MGHLALSSVGHHLCKEEVDIVTLVAEEDRLEVAEDTTVIDLIKGHLVEDTITGW